ncbi:MAG: MiaB/RimO family radical SAM methylthiotransferase, partial [Candidatus Cloacimonadaceae bacterium]|nr:MiaB/RimO family radical SAM methylthiotransferase [Candidatus Cloacimonadaceae bacterium]
MKSYYIESLGCAKNLVDSETFAYILERRGYQSWESAEGADIVMLNTCAFLQSALAELDDVLCQLAELKNQGLIGRLFVSGCVMNRALEDFQPLFPEVDAWIPLKDFARLEELINVREHNTLGRVRLEHGSHAYLRISDGCSNRCSYCTIPSIRGSLCSVPMEKLIDEAKALAEDKASPCTELIVIAQDTCSYGMDIYGKKMLPELLTELLKIDGIKWIRVMYMHPDHFETHWLKLWQEYPKLLPYFEIPVQHSEDRILKAMNRNRRGNELRELFAVIKKELPEAALRTTLISGFPGESKGEALALHKFVRETGFHHLGAFCYSPEPG